MTCFVCEKIEHNRKEKFFEGYKAGKNNLYQCQCGQRWFCYNDFFHLWGRVNDNLTWKFLTRDIDVPIAIGSVCTVIPGYEKYAVDPVHEICKNDVRWPKVILQPAKEDQEEIGVFQWFGEYQDGNIFNYQFTFPIIIPLEKFRTGLLSFKIPFIGKIKDWPIPDQRAGMAENFNDPKMEKHIVYLMSSDFSHDYGNGKFAALSFAAGVVLLGDPSVGIIEPRYFYNPTIAEMVNNEFMEKNPA